jgi:UDP-glucose 4-epimerase
VRAIAGKRPLYLTPVATGLAAEPLKRLGFLNLPPQALDLLRYGRGVDNSKLKSAGFRYMYTTAGAVRHFVEEQRLRNVVGEPEPAYHYDGDVETFFRHSPAVVRST